MQIKELQDTWDQLGKEDPLWAILSDNAKKGNKWDVDDFFRTGQEQIAHILQAVESSGVTLARDRALDFGCGIGRLTQALGDRFAQCCGVDISPSMIRHAERYNRHGGRCTYHLNHTADLTTFADGSFDFIVTVQVLQHMRPELSKAYLKEFLRVLKPGGALCFQVPCGLASGPSLADPSLRLKVRPGQPAVVAEPGRPVTVVAAVRNDGDAAWPPPPAAAPSFPILLGCRWSDGSGNFLADGKERAELTTGLEPHAEVSLPLTAAAPREPGDYLLKLDLVQPGVGWLGDLGSEPATVRVRVAGAAGAAESAPCDGGHDGGGGQIEMYVLPKHEVRRLLADAGGKLITVHDRVDEAWVSPYYLAVKV